MQQPLFTQESPVPLYTEESFDSCRDLLTLEIIQAVEEWQDPYPSKFSVTMQNPDTKYRASSAFQKCLRRGFVARAVYYAEAIYNSDVQSYLWNRLPLVALEDIGLGNWKFCAYVLHFCRFSKVRNSVNTLKALHWIIHHLAEGAKSRALSEAVCFAYFAKEPEECLTDEIAEIGDAMQALGWKPSRDESPLSPWHDRNTSLTREQLYQQVGEITEQDPAQKMYIRYCFHTGNKKNVAYQNASIPYVLRLYYESPEKETHWHNIPPIDLLHKMPDVTYDKHTYEGKKALKNLMNSGKLPLPYVTFRQLGLCVFQAESALIDKELTTPSLLAMQKRSQDYELVMVDMTLEDGEILKNFLTSEEGARILRYYRGRVF